MNQEHTMYDITTIDDLTAAVRNLRPDAEAEGIEITTDHVREAMVGTRYEDEDPAEICDEAVDIALREARILEEEAEELHRPVLARHSGHRHSGYIGPVSFSTDREGRLYFCTEYRGPFWLSAHEEALVRGDLPPAEALAQLGWDWSGADDGGAEMERVVCCLIREARAELARRAAKGGES